MLILSCIIWEIDRKSLDKNEVENLTNFVEVWLFKIFLKLPGYKPCIFERKCMPVSFLWFWHHAMCDFAMITRFGFRSLCDNGIRSRSVPFHFGWRILPSCSWGEKVPWLCVGQVAAYAAKRPHAREVLFDALSLLPMGGEKTGWDCCPWGQESAYQRGQYHASCEWMDPLTGLCGSVVYLW